LGGGQAGVELGPQPLDPAVTRDRLLDPRLVDLVRHRCRAVLLRPAPPRPRARSRYPNGRYRLGASRATAVPAHVDIGGITDGSPSATVSPATGPASSPPP